MSENNPYTFSERSANPYVGHEVIDISADDHVFDEPVRGIVLTASGDLIFRMVGDASGENITLPILVPVGGFFELRGWIIKEIIKTGTTATPYIGLK